MSHPRHDDRDVTTSVTPQIGSSLDPDRPLLIGRDRELAQIEAILERGRPALVVVSAATGMGKTSMLREVRARSAAKRWQTAYGVGGGDQLSVASDTTEETFRERLLSLLGVSMEGSFIYSAADRSRSRSHYPLLDELRRRAPVLLIIDSYRPNDRFAQWFAQSFIEGVKHAEAPVVVVVADQVGNVVSLLPFADETVTLGELDLRAVRQHFERVGRQIDPPMGAAELDEYVEAACKDPAKLNTLTRILTIARPGEDGTNSRASTHKGAR